jgi:8-oxo-dGTP pyrophosphatase MutT (NUDIX family)
MAISDYLWALRKKVGNDLLLVPSATALIFDDDGRILLALHSHRRLWVLPGGAIDPGESPADAVVREAWEETGLHVEPLRITGVYGGNRVRYSNGDEVEYITTTFECRRLSGTLRPDGEETLDVKFFERGELGSPAVAPWLAGVVSDAFERKTTAAFVPPTWHPDL